MSSCKDIGEEERTDFVDVFPTCEKILLFPFREKTEFDADETDLARPSPNDSRRSAI